MANLCKITFIGRLAADPESKTFSNGGRVCKLRLVSNRRKKTTSGWEDEPNFIDAEVFDRGENGKQATLAESSLRKGSNVFIDGDLRLDQWEDKNGGGKRSKHIIVVNQFQYLDKKGDSPAARQEPAGVGEAPPEDPEVPF